jgi:membrane-bound serine protease (ClpP class)
MTGERYAAVLAGGVFRYLLSVVLLLAGSVRLLSATDDSTRPAEPAETASFQPASRSVLDGPFDRAIIVPIEKEITEITLKSVQRRLETAREQKIPLVIFEMNTPGGALQPTLEICTAIRDLRREGIRSCVWVNKQAFSAGTIIALAADLIVMAPNAIMGDCQPIMITGTGPEAVPESIEAKATSPLVADLRTSAREGHYPLVMVMALIRPEIQVFWVVDTKTQERRFVDVRERDQLFGLPSPKADFGAKKDADKDDDRISWARVEPVSDSESKTDWRYVNEDAILGKVHQPIVDDRTLLTMPEHEALAYGFSRQTLASRSELASYFGITGPVEKVEISYWESFIGWLASPLVRSVLFILMLLGAYTEFNTPGLGLGGAVALVALVLFLGAPYLAGYTVTWEIVVILLGLVLVAVELFLIPGFGVAGILGIALLALGLIASFVPAEPITPSRESFHWPEMDLTYDYLRRGLYSLAGGLTGGIAGMVLLARYFPKVPVAGRIIAPNPDHDAVQAVDPYLGIVDLGDIGRSETLLRPAGKARFGDRLVDVVSLGEYIQAGEAVEVVERRGNRVVVRRIE